MTDTPNRGPHDAGIDLAWLAAAGDDWVCVLDEESRIAWSSPHARDWTGREAARLRGLRWLELLPAATDEPAVEALRLALLERDAFDAEVAWPATADRSARLRLRPAPVAGRWLAIVTDLTPRRRLEGEAHRLRELLDVAQEFGRLGVWERALPSGQGHWDRHVFRFWGLEPTGGAPDFEAATQTIHPDDRERVRRCFDDSTRAAGRYDSRYRLVRPDGSQRWIHSHWQVTAGPDGKPARAVGVMVDDSDVYRLAQSNAQANDCLRLATELANVAVWRHDLVSERVFHAVSPWHLAAVEPRHEGNPAAEYEALVHPDDRPLLADSARQALASGEPVDFAVRFKGAEGHWRHTLSRRVVQRDDTGRPIAFLGVSLDLTEETLRQQRSAELARRLDLAVSAARIGLWSRELNGSRAEWNGEMFRIYGRDPSAGPPTYDEWLAAIHPDDRASVRRSADDVSRLPGQAVDTTFRVLCPDGSIRWVENRATIEPGDSPGSIRGVAIDVTQRVVAERALRSVTDRAMLAARGAGIGTWVVDLETGAAQWDEQMFDLRGIPQAPTAPDAAARLAMVHPDDRHLFAGDDGPPQRPRSVEFRIVRPDGAVRWLASRSSAVNDDRGRPLLHVGVNWDITEAKAAAQAREEREAALRASRAKSQFLARVSHELRTPLNAILGFTQLLQIEVPPHSAQGTKLANIRGAGVHLLSLIDDVLDLSRLETDAGHLKVAPLDLSQAVAEAVPLISELAGRHGVTVSVQRVTGWAMADPLRLRQVLVNLLSNAIKYNRPGGRVLVGTVDGAPQPTLRIADDGRGMSAEQLAHWGEPFNRLGAEMRDIDGTGIGLTIVKALVAAMAGHIAVTSAPGRGTTVDVSLQLAEDLAAGATAPVASRPDEHDTGAPMRARETSPPPRGRLLYVEDNPVNVLLLEEFVRSLTGFEIDSVSTGTEGVERALQARPDVVLIDMQLPDIDGHEVLRRLRTDPRTAAVPCIALSANAMREDIDRALEAGFDRYCTKPIDFRQFVDELEALLPARRRTPA